MPDRVWHFEFGAAYCRICGNPDYRPLWQEHFPALPESSYYLHYTRDEDGTIWTTACAGCSLATGLVHLAVSNPNSDEAQRGLIAECRRYWERICNRVPPPPPGPPPARVAARGEAALPEAGAREEAGAPQSSATEAEAREAGTPQSSTTWTSATRAPSNPLQSSGSGSSSQWWGGGRYWSSGSGDGTPLGSSS